jgi:hypothetical protein
MATRDPEAGGTRSYRTTFRRLIAAHPGHSLSGFEPPRGAQVVDDFMKRTWGKSAPETYRVHLSRLHTFFEWTRGAGLLSTDPTVGLTYPPIERKPRRLITKEQTKQLLEANPEPRDQVPLRLLLTAGLPKGPLRHVRFSDFDSSEKTVRYTRRGEIHTAPIPDYDFWRAVNRLREQRRAIPEDYVLCTEYSRKDTVTREEFGEAERDGTLAAGRSYLWQDHHGRWHRANLQPSKPRGEHGAHLWWYRCVARAGLASHGATSGFPMMAARYTFGRRRFTRVGNMAQLQKELGGLASGSAWEVYKNYDALDKAIRRVQRRLRLTRTERIAKAIAIDGKHPVARWWKEPVGTFAQYVDDERDLVELSRVSITMLRTQKASSARLHDAAETLTRTWTAADLVKRAANEAAQDHPLLHGHSLIAIWSALEAMIGELVETWLLWWPPAGTRAGSKVALGSLRSLRPDEWAAEAHLALDRAYEKLNRKNYSPRRLDRYEWLLDAVALVHDPQDDDPQMRQNLWEMQQVRNVFAHNRGEADARFVAQNQHLQFNVGDEIRIDRHAWADFLVTTLLYADMVVRRMKRELGLGSVDWMRASLAPAVRYPPKVE